ncbi:MAG: hypothetical protein HQ553_15845 [Chloroflexi bacterium]|nr:hypothetical protein [Chloroflexota bacterium]
MAERVGIIAVGQTKYSPNRADVTEGELAYEAIKLVLEETGLTLSDVDSAVTSSQDFWDGRTISSLNIQSFVGAHLGHEDKVCEDAINAIYAGVAQILGRPYRYPVTHNSMQLSEWFSETRNSFLKLSLLLDKSLDLNLQ